MTESFDRGRLVNNRGQGSEAYKTPRFDFNPLFTESEEIFCIQLKENKKARNINCEIFQFTNEQLETLRNGFQVMAQVCVLENEPNEYGYPEGLRFVIQGNVYELGELEKKLVVHKDQLENKCRLQANITQYLRKTCEGKVGVEFNNLNGCSYYFGVFLVKPYDEFQLLNMLRVEGYITLKMTKKLIETLFEAEQEVVPANLKVTLICPLTQKNLCLAPCRGTQCKHVQCFEGITFLKMMQEKPNWRCPICYNYLPFGELKIDKYIMKVMKAVKNKTTAIFICKDGSWTLHENIVRNFEPLQIL